jgi:hypothetical protein
METTIQLIYLFHLFHVYLGLKTPDDEFYVCGPQKIGYFYDKDNLDEEAVFLKNEALALAHHSGIYMLKEDIDEYSLLYLQFLCTYCFDVALTYNTLIYHIFDNAHENVWILKFIINLLVQ